MNSEKKLKVIKISLFSIIIITIIFAALFMWLRYQVEGEKNMPFNIGKIIVISSAVTSNEEENAEKLQTEGENENPEEQEEHYIWNEKIIQTNDVYIYLDKNNNYKGESIIQNVRIENIKVLKKANIGKIQVYMPNSLDEELYKYINDFLVGTSFTYKGGLADNKKTLEIGNQGGCVCLSFANTELGRYKSNEDEQIEQGAFILEKMNLNEDDLKFKVSFDIIIDVGKKSYRGNIVLDMPVDGLIGNKESHTEITNFDNVIFKRF